MDAALGALLLLAVSISAVTDVRARRVPDWVTLPALAAALLVRLGVQGLGSLQAGLCSGLLAAAGGALLLLVPALSGMMGLGDVKLMAVVGAAVGAPALVAAAVFVSLAGAAQAVATVAWARARGRTPQVEIPYAVAIAVGSVFTLVWQHSHAS